MNTLAVRERAVRDDMSYAQAFVKAVDSDLTKALRQREEGGERFVAEMHPYHRWKRETKRSLEDVRRVLYNSERYGPHLARVSRT